MVFEIVLFVLLLWACAALWGIQKEIPLETKLLSSVFAYLRKALAENKALLIVLGVLLLTFGGMWQFVPRLREIGFNVFTDTIGIIITIFLIDRVIKQQEIRRMLPRRRIAHYDICLLLNMISGIWIRAYQKSVPVPQHLCIQNLFTQNSFALIGLCLNLDSNPDIGPFDDWWEYITDVERSADATAHRILVQHSTAIDPDIYALVHGLTKGFLELGQLMPLIRMEFEEQGVSKSRNLGNFYFVKSEHLLQIVELADWCKKEGKQLEELGVKPLIQLHEDFGIITDISNQPCRMNPNEWSKNSGPQAKPFTIQKPFRYTDL